MQQYDMRVVLYTRVSTRGQDTALQQTALTQYCQARGFEIVGEFTDTASGAKQSDRPGLESMLKSLKNGHAQAVVVYKLDRLGRSVRDLLRIVDEFNNLNVEFISMNDSIDTSTPTGKLVFHVVAAFAEFERDVIVSRCAAGRQQAISDGTATFGRPRRNLDVEAIIRKAAAGVPIAQIARKHKVSRPVITARIAEYRKLHSSMST